jgi:uncharacterized membrane protein YgcG
MKRKVFAVGFVVVMLVALLYSTAFAGVADVYLRNSKGPVYSNQISGNKYANYWLNVTSGYSTTAQAQYNSGNGWKSGGSATLSPGNSAGGQKGTADNNASLWRLRLTSTGSSVAAGTITSPV